MRHRIGATIIAVITFLSGTAWFVLLFAYPPTSDFLKILICLAAGTSTAFSIAATIKAYYD